MRIHETKEWPGWWPSINHRMDELEHRLAIWKNNEPCLSWQWQIIRNNIDSMDERIYYTGFRPSLYSIRETDIEEAFRDGREGGA